jgi:hypothetical protein
MKKNYFIFSVAALALGFISFQRTGNVEVEKFLAKNQHKNANGAPSAKTGAPGENNCTQCHSGTAQSGATENTFVLLSGITPVTSYTPGATYNVSVSMASAPAKKGFQATALSSTNVMAGTFTGQPVGGTSVSTSGGRKYANHTSTSNTSTNMAWVWTWTAPATNVGDVTFYVATNKANNNTSDSGDAIFLSQHIVGSTAGIDNNESVKSNFVAGYNAETNAVKIDFTSLTAGEMFFNLVDMNGRSVFTYEMGNAQIGKNATSIKLPNDLKNGIYFVNVFINNTPMSAKIQVQK